VNGENTNPWLEAKRQLERKLSAESYENWIARTDYAGADGRTLLVSAPDTNTVAYLQDEYAHQIDATVRALGLGFDQVHLVVRNTTATSAPGLPGATSDGLSEIESPITLNPNFTFDTFVVGSCNQFAHAAAQSVAEFPSRRYNPLYIYGGVGMGKTHLMHAIGRALLNSGHSRIIYTTSERFTNEVVSGIKYGKMPQLRERYRSADILLIDDIHSLGSRERTQEEFFHTFNELHEAQKQIVISSDCQPKEITGLVDRLRSRFEWGLMADIAPPDLETRMAILERKAQIHGFRIPPEILAFIAEKTKSSVRELEGALLKLIAVSSLTNAAVTMTMAKQALKHLIEKSDRRVTIEAVIKAVAERYGIKPAQLKEKSNRKEIVVPRQVAMFLVKELTGASLPDIGRAFGGKHHTTVLHSIDKIRELRAEDPEINKIIHNVTDSFQ
jgi:chromosomal replication initiator protein